MVLLIKMNIRSDLLVLQNLFLILGLHFIMFYGIVSYRRDSTRRDLFLPLWSVLVKNLNMSLHPTSLCHKVFSLDPYQSKFIAKPLTSPRRSGMRSRILLPARMHTYTHTCAHAHTHTHTPGNSSS